MIHVVLLSAPRGAGKSTVCQRFATRAREAGLRVGGVYCPARIDDSGKKIGIDAQDAGSEERRPLAEVMSESSGASGAVSQCQCDDDAMAWALDKVLTALDAPTDAVIIDEIGPLELQHDGGFAAALVSLATSRASSALITVRAELLPRLQDKLVDLQPVTLLLTRTNRDQVHTRILDEIWSSVIQGWQEN